MNSPPGTFSWQDPVHSWKADPDEVMNVENLLYPESDSVLSLLRWKTPDVEREPCHWAGYS